MVGKVMFSVRLFCVVVFASVSVQLQAACVTDFLERQATTPLTYNATYQGISADLTRKLSPVEQSRWLLEQRLDLILAGLTETSEVLSTRQGIKTLSYQYEQTGIGAKSRSLVIDETSGLVRVNNKGKTSEYQGASDLLDTQSHILQLQLNRACVAQNATQYRLNLAKRGGVREYVYDFSGLESLDLPGLAGLELERWTRVKGDQINDLWLDPANDYRLVRFEQKDGDSKSSLVLKP